MQWKYMLLWYCVFAQVRRVFNIHLSCILLLFVHTGSLIYGYMYLTHIPDIFKNPFPLSVYFNCHRMEQPTHIRRNKFSFQRDFITGRLNIWLHQQGESWGFLSWPFGLSRKENQLLQSMDWTIFQYYCYTYEDCYC